MFLANDTQGVLVLVPGAPILNCVIVSVVFMYVSNALSDSFNGLLGFFVVKNTNTTLIRLCSLALAVCAIVVIDRIL